MLEVRALCLYNSFGNLGWLEGISHPALETVLGDVRDPDFCRELCTGIDTVFHLAALIAIPYSYAAPDSYVDTNIRGTLNMLQGARAAAVDRIIVTSTSEVYGTAITVPISETHPRQPQSPYSATKIGADALALSFHAAFDLPVVIARPFNTYGPRQSARAIIPTIISQIASGRREIKVGDLTPTRDFNYVADTAAGFIAIARAAGVEGQEINIATGSEVSMAGNSPDHSLAHGSRRDMGHRSGPPAPCSLRGAPPVWRQLPDSASSPAGPPRFSLTQGLQQTIDWFTDPANLAKYKPDIYNR